MNYKVRVIMKDVYSVWVEADDDDTAELLAVQKVNNGDADVEFVHDSLDTIVDEVEEVSK